MKFKGGDFLNGVRGALTSIDQLKKGLQLKESTRSLADLAGAAKNFTMDGLGNAVQGVGSKFSAMSVVGVTALATLASQAVTTGLAMVKSLTIGPISEGYADYGRKLTSMQTIMNATGKDSAFVGERFDKLDEYADNTIYSLDDMTSAFAKFTNAGVDMDQSVPAIKGIANMVAVAGQDAGAASIAMYNLSQSIAGGFLTTTDYKSLNLANVATKEWKNQMIEGGIAAGKLKKNSDGMYTIEGSDKAVSDAQLFNEELSTGWASSEVLLGVLGKYGDETTEIGKKSLSAAQDVKSFSMMMETLKAGVGTSWTDSFETVIGDVAESKVLFTGLTNEIGGILDGMNDARNELLRTWDEAGGRTALIDTFKSAWASLKAIIGPIIEAFKEIFPPMTGQRLAELTVKLRDFVNTLKPSQETIDNVKSTAKGLFAVLDIGRMIIMGVVGVLARLIGAILGTGPGILGVTGNIGDFLVKMRDAIVQGDFFTKMFTWLGDVITKPIIALKEWMATLGLSNRATSEGGEAAVSMGERIEAFYQMIKPALDWMGKAFKTVGDAVKQFFKDADFNVIFGAINTGAILVVAGIIGGFFKNLIGNITNLGGLKDRLKDMMDTFTGTFEAMQAKLKADALIKIAIAIGIIAAAILILSFINPEKLAGASIAISILFAELMASMKIMDGITGAGAAVKMGIIATAMLILAAAMVIFAAAVTIMAALSWDEMIRGLAGMGLSIVILAGAMNIMAKGAPKMIPIAFGILVLSTAMLVLAKALQSFATLSFDEIARGISAMGLSILVLTGISRNLGDTKTLITGSIAIILLAASMKVLASAVIQFASMSMEEIAKGIMAMAGALIVIALAVKALPSSALPSGIALNIIAQGMIAMAKAIDMMGSMSWEEIGRGMTVLAGSLLILAGALYLMSGTIAGAAALVVASYALSLLAPAMVMLGSLSWEQIGAGLTMLVGVFAVLGVAGLVLAPVVPVILLLGIAIGLIGVAMLGAGIAMTAFALALTAVAALAGVGAAGITLVFTAILSLIPLAIAKLGEGIVAMAAVITAGAPAIVGAFVAIVVSLLNAVQTIAPEISETIVVLLASLLETIVAAVPMFLDAGLRLIIGLLNGIAQNINGVITAATNVIIAFITGIGNNAARVADAGMNTIITFVESLTASINQNAARMREAGLKLALAIVDGMTGGLASGAAKAINAAKDFATSALNAAKNALGIASPSKEFYKVGAWSAEGATNGMEDGSDDFAGAAGNAGKQAVKSMAKALGSISSVVEANLDTDPTIRPVLDLSGVRKSAQDIGKFLGADPIAVDRSFNRASSVAQGMYENASAKEVKQATDVIRNVEYKLQQNNYSPKALSTLEIYRQSKNLMSTVKEAVKTNA
jgi:hypothetical protein